VKWHGAAASLRPALEAARAADRAARTPPRFLGSLPATRTDTPAAEVTEVAAGWRFDVDEHGALIAVHDDTNTRVVIATPNPGK
jgi:hypothetical protein